METSRAERIEAARLLVEEIKANTPANVLEGVKVQATPYGRNLTRVCFWSILKPARNAEGPVSIP